MFELLIFFLPASILIIGALIVVFAKNPVHNAMGLVMTLVSLAIIYITLNATFVAMVQMLVYAGAVMTLFLFVIMMIGVDKKEQTSDSIKGQTFLVSGVFEKFSRHELKAAIKANGGKVVSSISGKLNYLLAGDKMGPAKLEKATKFGIQIISENEFIKMINI